MRQRWSDLLFLHWEVEAEQIAKTLPPDLTLDTFEKRAFLGIVPFKMEKIRPCGLPPVPGLSWFLELNLRTYVYDKNGRPGVWFYSLDANQPVAVKLAQQLFHLPYQHAEMSATSTENGLLYNCRRKPDEQTATYCYRGQGVEKNATPGTLEFFLLERYLLFSTDQRGQLKIGQVHHPPYPFQNASCEPFSVLPFTWNDFLEPKEPPSSILYSPGVDVEVFPLHTA